MGEMKNAYKILVGKLEGKRQLGWRRHRWKIMLVWVSGTQSVKVLTGFIWHRVEISGEIL
jgi:hypothetical protein